MCGFSIHSRAQWSLVVVGSLIPFIKLEPCKGMVRGCCWTGPRAGSRTPCIEINLCRHEFPRPPGPLPRVLYAQAAASLVAILFRRRGFSCLPGTEAWLQHVAVGGGGVRGEEWFVALPSGPSDLLQFNPNGYAGEPGLG